MQTYKGVPVPAGFRLTAKRRLMTPDQLRKNIEANMKYQQRKHTREPGSKAHHLAFQNPAVSFGEPEVNETDEEIAAQIVERFSILQELTDSCILGGIRSLIVSGPPGVGKSHTIETALFKWDPGEKNFTIIKGLVRATGLYKTLFAYRNKGQVIVFDDADSVFLDETALNLLKAVTDSSNRRRVSWKSEAPLYDEEGGEGRIPKSFDFEGTIIFLTNKDFDAMIASGSKLSPHLEAMISRAHYVDLAMSSTRHRMIRIRQVVEQGLLKDRGLNEKQQEEVIDFIEEFSKTTLRELSLRIVLKVADVRKHHGDNWRSVAKITCCRRK